MTEIGPEALINNFHTSVQTSEDLATPGFELHSEITLEGEKVDFPIHSIEDIEPGPEPGTFVMRLKHEIVKNRGLILVITGASLLALSGLIVQKQKSSGD